ncbi:MAG: M1 family metallopeptidase [Winogradskyella sp.]|nr:M1 family metallopeptidase [Winogradskyella sp.]
MKNVCLLLFVFVNCITAQQTDYVDFIEGDAMFGLVPDSSKVFGLMSYKFKILRDVDSLFIDAKNMTFEAGITLNDKKIDFKNNNKQLWLYHTFKKDSLYEVLFNYQAYPKQALYFLKRQDEWNIWTQGQGKYTSHWLPSFDDVNEKVIFTFSTLFKKDYTIIMNGRRLGDSLSKTVNSASFVMQHPMSSYLVALAIGKYKKESLKTNSGVPLELYYFPKDSLKVEPTYRYSKRMFNFMENEIGVRYPWYDYKQVPVHDFLYAGMENTTLTIFSDAFVVDPIAFNDRNYVNVNAHELAHQWFGNLVTATSGEHHWLQEGFATYYALLAEQDIFGEDYFYWKLYESALQLKSQDVNKQGSSLLYSKASSLTFYQRGAWVLHALKDKIGASNFKLAVKAYLEAYKFKSVSTEQFISKVIEQSEMKMDDFVKTWIIADEFPYDLALALLKKQSVFIQEYEMVDCEAMNSQCYDYLNSYISDKAKIKIIRQAPQLVNRSTFRNNLMVRQAIAQYLTKIPLDLKEDYETLLNDKSYQTIEYALYKLWLNFPEERSKYLNATRNIEGFSDKNIRLLWLVLCLNTLEYKTDQNSKFYDELVNYTSSKYNAEIRLKAFQYLDLMQACGTDCKQNLMDAKSHHNWRLVKFAKDLDKRLQ